jgi:hypothetical protein
MISNNMRLHFKYIFLWILFCLYLSSCSILVGNIKPTYNHSTSYSVLSLESYYLEWKQINDLSSDLVYQSEKTKSRIALTTLCKKDHIISQDVKTLSNELLHTLEDAKIEEQTTIQLAEKNAYSSIYSGNIQGEMRIINTVVLVNDQCIYDFILISQEKFMPADKLIFEKFVRSFQLKKNDR